MRKAGRKRLYVLAGGCIAVAGALGYGYWKRHQYGAFCWAVKDGASLSELTEYWERHDPNKLVNAPVGLIEHTTKGAYACTYEVSGGKVVSAKSL